ncbi:MAG: hypothetical protein JSR96_03010 [Proteobacteria bacterium]|nr:hypothetical protein [Pseudomonadota bacterium]
MRPQITKHDDNTTFTVDGDFQARQYFEKYGTDLSGYAGANLSQRLSERTTATASAGFRTSRTAMRDVLHLRGDPAATNNPDLVLIDPGLIGTRLRTEIVQASAGLTYVASQRSSWTLGANYAQSWTDSATASDYRYLGGRIGYSHVLSEHTSLIASVDVGSSNYLKTNAGDGFTVSPQVGVSTRLSPTVTLSTQGGVTFASVTQPDGSKRHFTSLAGSFRLCKAGANDSYCLNASRAAQPTVFGGLRSLTRIALDYTRTLNRRDSFTVTGDYTRNDGFKGSGVPDQPNYFGGQASFNRKFNDRFYGFVTAGVEKATNSIISRPANLFGSIGVRYVFGDLR